MLLVVLVNRCMLGLVRGRGRAAAGKLVGWGRSGYMPYESVAALSLFRMLPSKGPKPLGAEPLLSRCIYLSVGVSS